MMTMSKHKPWNWRDIYRLPVALGLWPMVCRNYALRRCGELPDEWYGPDALLWHWGYSVRAW